MLRYLLEKEFKLIVRDRFLPKLILLFPFMTLALIPLVANFDVKNVKLTLVDHDQSALSRRMTHPIAASGYFLLAQAARTYPEALTSVEEARADLILEIPSGFERELVGGRAAHVQISANAVNGTQAALGANYLAGMISGYGAELAPARPPMVIVPQFRFNPFLVYRIFMAPAIMVMTLTMLCGFLPALNIVTEKEKGTIEQMNVTPVRRSTFILSKVIPYWVIGFLGLTVALFVAWLFYGLIPRGSLATLYGFAAVFILAISGLGLCISNYARTSQQAMFMMFFFVLSLIFMSGLYTPVASMPEPAQWASNLSPLKYFIMVMRQVYLKGSAAGELRSVFWALGGFALAFNGWAVVSYRKQE